MVHLSGSHETHVPNFFVSTTRIVWVLISEMIGEGDVCWLVGPLVVFVHFLQIKSDESSSLILPVRTYFMYVPKCLFIA